MLLFALGKLPTEQLEVDFRDVEYFVACRWVRGYINSFADNGVQLLDDLRGVCAIAVFLQGIIEKAMASLSARCFCTLSKVRQALYFLKTERADISNFLRLSSSTLTAWHQPRPYFSQIPLRF